MPPPVLACVGTNNSTWSVHSMYLMFGFVSLVARCDINTAGQPSSTGSTTKILCCLSISPRVSSRPCLPYQMSKVGMSMDYALCKGTRKDGKSCTMPVNKAEGGGYCEFHVVAASNRAQRQNPLKNKPNAGNNNNRNNGSNGSTIAGVSSA